MKNTDDGMINTSYFVSYHGRRDETIEKYTGVNEVRAMVTDVFGFTDLDGAMYEIFKSHYFNSVYLMEDFGIKHFYNHSAVILATNNSYYVQKFFDEPPTDVIPNVLYLENGYACKKNVDIKHPESFLIDYTTVTAEFSTFMKIVSLWKIIEYDRYKIQERLSFSLSEEPLLRMWLNDLGIQIKVRNVYGRDDDPRPFGITTQND